MSDDICNPNNYSSANFSTICLYVSNVTSCSTNSGGFINYYTWQYCAFNNRVAPSILMFLMLLVFFITIAITADSFFAPCLVIVARMLRMSQNIAGVTLLALANGSPDVFSSLSAITSTKNPNLELAIGSIFGAGILVNCIAAGTIMILCPFNVMRRPIMKDLIFYFIAILWCMIILIRRSIELWSSLVLLMIYVVYVFVTGISRFVFVKCSTKKESREIEVQVEMSPVEVTEIPNVVIEEPDQIAPAKNGQNDIISPKAATLISDRNSDKVSTLVVRSDEFDHGPNSLHVPGCYDNHVSADHSRRSSKISSNRSSFNESATAPTFRRIASSSHRRTGYVAKLVIENEQHRISKIENAENQVSHEIRRTQSLSVDKPSGVKAMRFSSAVMKDEAKWKFKVDNESKKEDTEQKKEKKVQVIGTKSIKLKDGRSVWIPADDETIRSSNILADETEGVYTEYPGLFKHFLLTLCPVDLDTWKEQSLLSRIQSIIQSPMVFALTCTIPVIDDDVFMKGWCKLLNALHCLVSPMIWVVFIKVNFLSFGNSTFLVSYFIIIVGGLLGCGVFITSKADCAPAYHNLFAIMGFLTSIIWIYELANEIVNILSVFGVVFNIPAAILGLSVLAFANSIGDLVSNITLSKKGFPRIGYTACIGGPLFNLLIGIGLPFTILIARTGSYSFSLSPETIVLIFTDLLVTGMNIIALPILRFHLTHIYGIILISIYCLFLICVLLFAAKVIRVTL